MAQKTYSRMWEQISGVITGGTYRLQVPGGWIVKEFHQGVRDSQKSPLALVFVPDPNHDWLLDTDERDEQFLGELQGLNDL